MSTIALDPASTAKTEPVLPAKSARYQMLDAWRGLSCLALVVFHATMQLVFQGSGKPSDGSTWSRLGDVLTAIAARTWIGVPIFFVISGYCIMATIDSRRRKSTSIADYVHRRVRRIYPPYLIALAVSCVAIYAVETYCYPGLLSGGIFTIPKLDELSGWQWFGNFTLTETWRPYLAGDGTSMILPNTWTLCYEEQFYLLAGVILFACPRRIFLGAIAVTGLSVAVKVATKLAGVHLDGIVFDGRWLLIAAGIMVYYRINYATVNQTRIIYALLVLGVLGAGHPRELLTVSPNHAIERFVAYGFALLICLLYPYDKRISSWSVLKPLTFCGQMSYSIYLMHPVVTKAINHGAYLAGWTDPFSTCFVVVPVCVGASMVLSLAFNRLVERHFINADVAVKSRPTTQPSDATGLIGRQTALG